MENDLPDDFELIVVGTGNYILNYLIELLHNNMYIGL